MGHADKVFVDEIGSQKCVIFQRNSEENKLSTIVVRGSTNNLLDNVEKTVGKLFYNVKRMESMLTKPYVKNHHIFLELVQQKCTYQPNLKTTLKSSVV